MMSKRLTVVLVITCILALAVAAYAADVLKRFDKIAVGPTSFSTGVINIAPGTTAAKGIYFGKDTTLYRSAADTLKTDDALTVTGASTLTGAVTTKGNATLGDAATDVTTCTGRLAIRQVTDAGPMSATPGTKAELVYNTSNDKVYVCTVASETAATWGALN